MACNAKFTFRDVDHNFHMCINTQNLILYTSSILGVRVRVRARVGVRASVRVSSVFKTFLMYSQRTFVRLFYFDLFYCVCSSAESPLLTQTWDEDLEPVDSI